MSSVHSYRTLSKLRIEYLTNLGHETFRSIHLHSRGQIRSHLQQYRDDAPREEEIFNSAFWERILEEGFSYNQENLVFLAVIDEAGKVLASAGEVSDKISTIPLGLTSLNGMDVYVMEAPLPPPRGPPPHRKRRFDDGHRKKWEPKEPHPRERSLRRPRRNHLKGRQRIGLSLSSANFIMKQARIQLLTSCLAILALAILAFYFLRTLRRFIKLEDREKSERHLTAMGRMGATLAHEIRNPLGAMKGLTQVVQEELPSDHNAQKSLTTIVRETERLEHLVSDLLRYSKPKTIKIEKIDLNKLCNEIENVVQLKLQETQSSILFSHKESKTSIYSDKNGLRQVLLNVIVNAIEATPTGKSTQVNTMVNEKKEFVIEVIDEGQGLDTKTPEEFFEPFMTTKLQGTGLGLSISRKIVDNLGGTIQLRNNHDVGTTCIIKIPSAQ